MSYLDLHRANGTASTPRVSDSPRPPISGFIVSVRPMPKGLQTWEFPLRGIAVIALDGGPWCFGGSSMDAAESDLGYDS